MTARLPTLAALDDTEAGLSLPPAEHHGAVRGIEHAPTRPLAYYDDRLSFDGRRLRPVVRRTAPKKPRDPGDLITLAILQRIGAAAIIVGLAAGLLGYHRSANAATWVDISLASHHTQPRADGQPWNETNPGAGIDTTLPALPERVSLIAGAYRNSFFRPTVYAGLHWRALDIGPVQLGASAALASGYPHTQAIAGLTATIEAGDLRLRLIGLPPISGKHAGVIGAQIGIQIQ